MAKKILKKKNQKFGPWVEIPPKDTNTWLSEFLVSSMVLHAKALKGDKLPTKIRLPKECVTDNPDGSAMIHYEVQF